MGETRKKRFQFSLLALLVFTFLAACGLFANYLRERSLLERIRIDDAIMKETESKRHQLYDAQHRPVCTALGLQIKSTLATYKPDKGDRQYPVLMLHGGTDVVVIRDKFALMGPTQTIKSLAERPDDIEKAYAECVAANKAEAELTEKYSRAWDEICQISREKFYFFHAPDPKAIISSR